MRITSFSIGGMLAIATVLTMLTADAVLAAKGGNGGGKPGGGEDPPPTPLPVTYKITAPTMPYANFYFNDFNESGAVVGWNQGGDGADDARPVVYLPDVSTTQAFYLDDPELGLPSMPTGYGEWHVRSALAINNHGDIGGNIEPFGNTSNTAQAFVFERSAPAPALHILGPFDPGATREYVAGLNDSGDVIVVSNTISEQSTSTKWFYGQLGMDSSEYVELTFGDGAYSAFDLERLGNRVDGNPAVLAGRLRNNTTGDQEVFRGRTDGSFEVFEPYKGEDGKDYGLNFDTVMDGTDSGDVSVWGSVSSKTRGAKGAYHFAALWEQESGELSPVTGGQLDPSLYKLAYVNNSFDALMPDQAQLWHNEFSATEGLISIADALDASDPNRLLVNRFHELTDHGTTGWPTIFATGTELIGDVEHNRLFILTPELVSSSALATAAVPEPASWMLTLAFASFAVTYCRRPRRQTCRTKTL